MPCAVRTAACNSLLATTPYGLPHWPVSTRSLSGCPADLTWRVGCRLDGLGEPHGGIVTGHAGWVLVGLHDPDGIEIRLYTLEEHNLEGRR
ncbi:MAG: hypothetical protein ACRDST_06755 [Pseudonocardiaceae bacterium]